MSRFNSIFGGSAQWLLALIFYFLVVTINTEALKIDQVPGLLQNLRNEVDQGILSRDWIQNLERDLVATMKNISYKEARPHLGKRKSAKYTPATEKIGEESNINLASYILMTTRYNITRDLALQTLQRTVSPECSNQNETICDELERFRSINGTCNNLANPDWGASFTPFSRLLDAVYEDRFNEPRGGNSSEFQYLPNPRKITTTLHYDVISPDVSITNMVPQFGQFLDHDMTLAPEADRRCCTTEPDAADCYPIAIPENDVFYSQLLEPQTCMDFTRSTPYCFPGKNGIREQFNILTAFVDASQVYGSENERADQLRALEGGRLLTRNDSINMLPTVEEVEQRHGIEIPFMGKYLAGDERVNEMPALTTMHILLVREHNRIADEIRQIQAFWTDQQIFDEARHILIAEWQNIVYGEYLPVILGPVTMKKFNLSLDVADVYTTYDPEINPTIFQSFATAAYRFGHTLINGIIRLYKGMRNVGRYRVKDNFFEPEQVENGDGDGYNLILAGLIQQNAQSYDPHVSEALTNFLLRERTEEFGADLLARNVHRAREHGVPSYTAYRELCGLSRISGWENQPEEILPEMWRLLEKLYRVPQEIDLFTGGISEIPVQGGFSGATFNCLKAEQFHRVKYGDRFFFTHGDQAGSFTVEQIRQLRKRTLGDILCENSNLDMTSVKVFRTPSASNPQLYCDDPIRARLNITLFVGPPEDSSTTTTSPTTTTTLPTTTTTTRPTTTTTRVT